MEWLEIDTITVIAAGLSALSCALLGNFMLLRKQSMMGDAISHAVLPGLALGFLLTHSRDSVPMFIGACVLGVLTALFTTWIHRLGKVEEGASMGVVFTILFALGLIMIRQAEHVDIDPSCVLFGAVEFIYEQPTVDILGIPVQTTIITLALMYALNLVFVLVLFKELRLSSFDPGLSSTLGFNAEWMNVILMAMVAATTVASFEAVGSILVIAMLVVPPAIGYLLTDRLGVMVIISQVIAVLIAGLGHIMAFTTPPILGIPDAVATTASGMAVAAGLLFAFAVVLSPRHGLVAKQWRRLMLSVRIVREDILGLIFKLEESGQHATTEHVREFLSRQTFSPVWVQRWAMSSLHRQGLMVAGANCQLTEQGREQAAGLVRNHRLWETYLSHHAVSSKADLDIAAHRLEHIRHEDLVDQIDQELSHPDADPHGSPIPRSQSSNK